MADRRGPGCLKFVLIAFVVIIGIVVAVSVAGGGSSDSGGGGDEAGGQDTLRYEMETSEGTAAAVTYVKQDFATSQEQSAPSGWTAEVEFDSRTDALGSNMNAQNSGGGTITCRMYWNDELVSENSSNGDFAVVTCALPTD